MATEQPQQTNQRWLAFWQLPTATRYRFAFTLIFALALIRLLQGLLSRFVSLQAVLQKSGVRASSIVSRIASTSPDIVALAFVALILVLIMLGYLRVVWWFAVVYLSVETLRLLLIVVGFILTLVFPVHAGLLLLRDGAIMWCSTILLFALWFWLIDGGGVAARQSEALSRRDFSFPHEENVYLRWENWRPQFVDYLYLAYTVSTSFSPNYATMLSRRAELLCMLQGLLSLIIIAVLASRAINLLQ